MTLNELEEYNHGMAVKLHGIAETTRSDQNVDSGSMIRGAVAHSAIAATISLVVTIIGIVLSRDQEEQR